MENIDIMVIGDLLKDRSIQDKITDFEVIRILDKRSLIYPFKVFKVIAKFRPDIVHCQYELWLYGRGIFSIMFIIMLIFLKILRKPIIVTIHGVVLRSSITSTYLQRHCSSKHLVTLKRNYFTFLIKTIGELSSKIIVHLNVIKKILIGDYGYHRHKVIVIPHGIDPSLMKINKYVARERLRLPQDKIILLCFGEIRRGKGLEYILEAISKLREKSHNILLLIIGPYNPKDSPESRGYLNDLIVKIKRLKLEGNVDIRPYFIPEEEVYKFIAASDAMLLLYEDIETIRASGPLYRAATYNLPVIIRRSPMFLESIDYIKPSLIINYINTNTIVNIINDFLDFKEVKIKYKVLTWNEVAKKTLNLYLSLLKYSSIH